MRRAFARPGFTRLFAGMSTSMFGDAVLLLVLSMWVKDLTGSNGKAGLTFFWMIVPALFGPFLGIYIDRVRRRPLLVWGNVVSALMVLPLLLVHDSGDVWIVYSVAFCYGISFVVLPAALNGLLKELMPDDLLVEANSSLQTVKEGYRLFGPLVGAGLYAGFGGGAVALVDAASFLVAAAVIASIRLPEHRPERSEERWLAELTAGIRHLAHERVLRHVVVAVGTMLAVLGFMEASIYALLDLYDKPTTYAGVLISVQGVGAVAGGLTTSRWVRRLGEPGALAIGLVVMGLSTLVIAAASAIWLVMAGMLLCGYALPLLIISFYTLLQRRTPQRLLGRASAAVETVLSTPQAISIAVGAGLVTLLDVRVIFAIVGAVTLLSAAYLALALRAALWHPEPPADVATLEAPIGLDPAAPV